jgi:hypothetical protein
MHASALLTLLFAMSLDTGAAPRVESAACITDEVRGALREVQDAGMTRHAGEQVSIPAIALSVADAELLARLRKTVPPVWCWLRISIPGMSAQAPLTMPAASAP